jgi:hypothetical protein
MKPRFQCVLTQWMSGFSASGSGPIFMINLLSVSFVYHCAAAALLKASGS